MPNRNNRFALGFLWTCAVVGAQTGAGQFASVSGAVTNSVTGQPIHRAHVVLNPVSSTTEIYGAMTDATGKFSILRIPPGSYSLHAERIGHILGNPQVITLQAGDDKSDLKVSLRPAGWITGRVVDSVGEPVEGATVQIVGGSAANAIADDRGQFRIADLTPGRYRLIARIPQAMFSDEIRSDGPAEPHYATTYYPSSIDARLATRVTVKPGVETGGIEIRMVRSPIVRVSGVVTGFAAGARNVMVHMQSPTSGKSAAVKPDGKFELWGIDPGHYHVYAAASDPKEFLQSAPAEVEVEQSDIKDLELRMIAPFTINGTLRYEDDQSKPPAALQIFLQPEVPGFGRGFSPAEVHADGSFEFQSGTPGRYVVDLSWPNGYVRSMQLGGIPIDGRVLDLTNGAAGQVSLLVSSSFAEISGKVDGVADAEGRLIVLATPDPAEATRRHYVSVNTEGSYRLTGLPPGKYRLGIVDESGLRVFAEDDEAIEITLAAGDRATKNLKAPTQ